MGRVFVGIDASYTGFALCAVDSTDGRHPLERLTVTTDANTLSPPARLAHIREKARNFVALVKPDGVLIEGYSFGSRNGREQAGELGGVIRVMLWEQGLDYGVVPPTTLKKWVTGKGTGAKEIMIRDVFRRWGYVADDNNDSDAFALAQLGLALSTKRQTKALADVRKKINFVGANAAWSRAA